jgi:hypothetical protein
MPSQNAGRSVGCAPCKSAIMKTSDYDYVNLRILPSENGVFLGWTLAITVDSQISSPSRLLARRTPWASQRQLIAGRRVLPTQTQ